MRCRFYLAALAVLWVLFPSRGMDFEENLGPLYARFPLTLESGSRTEILGPFFSAEQLEQARTWAFSPLLSHREDASTGTSEYDFLYPIATYDRFGSEYRWQFLQLFNVTGGPSMEDQKKGRVSLFPLYFHQRSPDPALNYTAVVPFYGRMRNHFFRDEIYFVMLPAYLRTRKKDVVTDNYLAPFFHRRRGDALRGWQFWPVVGHEHKDATTRTNQYDEIEVIGGHDKFFALWPIFFQNDLGLGTTNLQTQRLLLPLYSAQRSPTRDTTSILWPLGYTYTVDRERKYREWALPWPLIDFARGEGKTLNRVWPFFSRGKTATLQSEFYLWPLYKHTRLQAEPLDRDRTRLFYFLYSDLVERNTSTGTALQRTDFWPLFTYRRDHNGNQRLQVLAPIEPLVPNNSGIARNYAPFWSLWRSEKNAKTRATSQSFLWNLYRRETTPEARKCSLFFGLIQYQSGPAGTRWRLFYFPPGKHEPRAPESARSANS